MLPFRSHQLVQLRNLNYGNSNKLQEPSQHITVDRRDEIIQQKGIPYMEREIPAME